MILVQMILLPIGSYSHWLVLAHSHVSAVQLVSTCELFPLFFQLKNKFMKKIPRDAEASNVMIGEVDFLDKPFVSFVRLAQATTLGGLTEVPVPTR